MELKKKKIPDSQGIYFFLGKKQKILYIGKATSLKSRVSSYFSADISKTRGPLIVQMLTEAVNVKWQTTDSVLEALILEAKLIRKYKPRYNTKEKDNRSFNYVVITKEDFPKILTVREHELTKKNLDAKYEFGPFPSGTSLKIALSIIRRIFPFRDQRSQKNQTFYQQLGLAPNASRKEYGRNIQNIKMFFEGKKGQLIKKLQKEMKGHAEREEFELANQKKKQIFALEHIQDVALVGKEKDLSNNIRIEAYDVAHTSGQQVVGVMTVVESGVANRSQYRKFRIKEDPGINDTKALGEIIDRRLGHPEWLLPRLMVVDGSKAQKNIAEKILRGYGLSIPIVAVVKDERHRARNILGDTRGLEKDIILANSEAHRFALAFHRKERDVI